jgi:hypoxanthine-DNA glycosylase
MHAVRCFPPIARRDARLLILGSMPGAASLAAGQYYAHPRNAFWSILGSLLDFAPAAPYPRRVQALKAARIAVWDVLHDCTRRGSLDSAIERDSEIANDFATFFRRHPQITHVFFNGARAEQAFRRHALPGLDTTRLRFIRLPSTSPAHAARTFAQKRAAWRAGLGGGRMIL